MKREFEIPIKVAHEQPAIVPSQKASIKRFNRFSVVLMASLLIVGGAAVYFYIQFNALKRDPQQILQKEADALIASVSRLIVFPEGERPTVATVTNPERLQDQPFFARAKKGYKILIFTNAKKAIMYDPENDKIVDVAPINIGAPSTENSRVQEPSRP